MKKQQLCYKINLNTNVSACKLSSIKKGKHVYISIIESNLHMLARMACCGMHMIILNLIIKHL